MGDWTKFDFEAITREYAECTMQNAYDVISKIHADFVEGG